MTRKTLHQLSLEAIIALGENNPEAFREARQATIDFIRSYLAPIVSGQGGASGQATGEFTDQSSNL